jgi:multisubunit Na+/H+ antiporter MnhF subunit
MNLWLVAATALVVGLAACGLVCLREQTMDRLVALELGGLLTALAVVLLAEGFDRVSLYDLALTLVLLSFASTMVFAHFLERWL